MVWSLHSLKLWVVNSMAGGRPPKVIDYALVERLASIQCTQEEIANILEVSTKTLQRNEEFCLIYKKGLDNGRMSLRRFQWEAAKKGNTTMLVWLGKQYLGQREPRDDGDAPEDIIEKDMDAYEE